MTFGDAFPPQPVPPTDDRRPRFSVGQVVLGSVILLTGVGWLLDAIDAVDVPWVAALPAALIVVGIGLIAGAREGMHAGLVAVGVILTLVMSVGSSVDALLDVPFRGGIGERTERPTTLAAVDSPYRLAIGELRVDLDALPAPDGRLEIDATVGIGRLVVDVPDGVDVVVQADVAIGNSVIFGAEEGGIDISRQVGTGAEAGLVVDLAVGIGEVVVRR